MPQPFDRERAWNTLRSAGVPLGHAAPAPSAPMSEVRDALHALLSGALDEVERDAIAAWLGALRRHWPSVFAAISDPRAGLLFEQVDHARYLKLRRIALARIGRQWN